MPSFSGVFTLQAQMQAKAANNWPDPNVPSVIGQAFGGGYYAGQIGVSSVATHYLIIGPVSTAETTLAWKNANTATPNSDSAIDGPQNTADMVADGNSTVYPCAHFCNNLSTGGQTDWYMAARNELEICYFNLKPTTTSNDTGSGINANAVPSRGSNYTAGNPAQTTSTDFRSTGAEDFATVFYWSSTTAPAPSSATASSGQRFNDGQQYANAKSYAYKVRAVRRVAV